jgi:hypothetical protein
MKSKLTPIVLTFLVILLVISAVRYMTEPSAIEPFADVGRLSPSGVTNDAGGGPSQGPSTRTSCPRARRLRANPST